MTSQPEERSVDSSALARDEPEEFVWPPSSADVLEPVETDKAPSFLDVAGPAAGDPLLSDILASGVTFEWHHAVAVIQQLLAQLAPDGPPDGNLPEAWAIRLTASGEVNARLVAGPELQLAGLGTLLHQLLAGRPQPAALRLLVMQATATEQAISLASLREGLGQWERPNRQQSLASLYEDAKGKVTPSAGRVLPMPSVVTRAITPAAPPAPAPAEAVARANTRRRQAVPMAGIAAVAGLGVAIVLLVLVLVTGGNPADAPAGPEAAAPEDPAAAAVVEPARPESVTPSPARPAAASNASSSGGPGASVPSNTGATPPARGRTGAPPAARAPTASSTATARTAATLPTATIPGIPEPGPARRVPALSGTESAILPPAPERAPVLSAPSPRLATTPATAAGRSRDGLDPPAPPIYAMGDPGVTGPVALSTLPALPEPGARPADLAVLELVIDDRGEVESATFLNPDPHFRDRWWISAAKTWKFQPARLDGQPVRFRARLTFMSGATLDPRVADR